VIEIITDRIRADLNSIRIRRVEPKRLKLDTWVELDPWVRLDPQVEHESVQIGSRVDGCSLESLRVKE